MPVLGTKTIDLAGVANVQARILKDRQDPLISVPRLCSNGYTVTCNKHEVQVHDADGKMLASGDRDPGSGGLYKLYVTGTGTGTASAESELDACYVVEEQPGSNEDLADGIIYYMPNLFTYYGGISFKNKAERVSFYHAAQGHLRQHLKGVRSTRAVTNDITAANHAAVLEYRFS